MAEADDLLQEVEERAGEQLGIRRWDRPAIFRDAATAAADADLPYWLVLALSGAIATLGLALDSSAVVIGAMLIAPLLGPVVGLALAVAVGDGRLALQTALLVVVSTLAVVAVGALMTLMLPFNSITAEITARTRPTTLDLGIAVLSGLAGVVVTVARGHRLSAAIPGVAVAVALIPPLGVTGYGVGSGWNPALIRGSLLLYGANLAGIVLSGTLVFLLVGMHRADVLAAARQWHEERQATGLMAWVDRFAWVRRLGVIRSTVARIGLVLVVVVALSIPLSRSLAEITREVRVRSAVDAAVALFEQPGRSSVLSRQVVPLPGGTQVYLRVATTRFYGDQEHDEFVRLASAQAEEPVSLVLEQLPATTGDVAQLAKLLPTQGGGSTVAPQPSPTRIPTLVGQLRERLRRTTATLSLPDGVAVAGLDLSVNGAEGSLLRVAYAAERPLPPEAEQILARQLSSAVADSSMRVELVHLSVLPRRLTDDGEMAELAATLARYPELRVELVADSAALRRVVARLGEDGVRPERIVARPAAPAQEPTARLVPPPASRTASTAPTGA